LEHLEQSPLAGHALEVVHAAVVEVDPGASDEVLHGARDEHLSPASQRRDARANVHGEPADLPVDALALAGVQAGADLEAERANAVADRASAPDGADRAF